MTPYQRCSFVIGEIYGHESKNLFFSQEKLKYEIMANAFKSLDDVINLYCELHERYLGIIAIIDGVRSPVSVLMRVNWGLRLTFALRSYVSVFASPKEW